ncbi:UDP-N-acetylmuramoyl-tripeptide--D-alanyl-D-alanine ligase [Denitratimonas sp. CY0512]|uniref:UDP-N-acetylmuramoyl-tripeptide--D-alanyl-D- alanine ligase n=1 Tax=Denitratimonas sp. CY0512 TaxID=3131940 RepID=UPI0030A83CC2
MKPLPLSTLATWCDARLHGEDTTVHAIGNDTRRLQPGSLYVALRGENFDGHDFCAAAMQAGAAALLVAQEMPLPLPQLVCADPLRALGRIAAGLAATRATRVIGITGSSGKTTTRTLLHSILQRPDARIWSNPGNHNNEIGLPLALIAQPEDARIGIYEMGAGAPGDIAWLAGIARPHIALVTNIAPAHLERMGSLLGIADTKAAIFDALPADGIAVVNADDAFAPYFIERAGTRQVIRYALDASAEVVAEAVEEGEHGSRFLLRSPWGQVWIELPLPGRHQISNALAAATLAMAAGASLQDVSEGLMQARGVPGRQQPHQLSSGALLLDDSYNANPGSVAAAIALLATQAKARDAQAWLVLGDMRELGPGAAVLHAEVGQRAREAGLARVLSVGEMSRHAVQAFGVGGEHFADQAALVQRLRGLLAPDVVCLVKGSRGSRMDRVVAALTGVGEEDGHAA